MSVRDALLGILTLGPAYGLQLHAELGARAPHRAKTNVGQVYGTLDRLTTAGLVAHQGLTEDGLPLYVLTQRGSAEALAWLEGTSLSEVPEWADVQDQVLISSSVNNTHSRALMIALIDLVKTPLAATAPLTPAQHLQLQADIRYREAVSNWLMDVESAAVQPQPGYIIGRPKRGRPAKR